MSGVLVDPLVNIPPILQQGDTITWVDQPFRDASGVAYDSSGWDLVYTLLQNGGTQSPLSVTAVAQGTAWLTTLSVSTTRTFVPQFVYLWQAQLQGKGGNAGLAVTVNEGSVGITASLAAARAGYDGRSQAVIALAAWKAAFAALAGTGGPPVLQYKVGTRELRYRDMKEIQEAIAYWTGVVSMENAKSAIAQGLGNPRKLYARFRSTFGG